MFTKQTNEETNKMLMMLIVIATAEFGVLLMLEWRGFITLNKYDWINLSNNDKLEYLRNT